jgi:hypothetical protein
MIFPLCTPSLASERCRGEINELTLACLTCSLDNVEFMKSRKLISHGAPLKVGLVGLKEEELIPSMGES